MKMRCSKHIIAGTAQRVMANFGFGRRFNDLNVILSCFAHILFNNVFNISTCTLFAPSFKNMYTSLDAL